MTSASLDPPSASSDPEWNDFTQEDDFLACGSCGFVGVPNPQDTDWDTNVSATPLCQNCYGQEEQRLDKLVHNTRKTTGKKSRKRR